MLTSTGSRPAASARLSSGCHPPPPPRAAAAAAAPGKCTGRCGAGGASITVTATAIPIVGLPPTDPPTRSVRGPQPDSRASAGWAPGAESAGDAWRCCCRRCCGSVSSHRREGEPSCHEGEPSCHEGEPSCHEGEPPVIESVGDDYAAAAAAAAVSSGGRLKTAVDECTAAAGQYTEP